MKPITEKQIAAIRKLSRVAKVVINSVEKMNSFEASKVIEGLIKKLNEVKKPKRDFSSDALAGLAVKILAQRCKVEWIISKEAQFKQRASDLYRVFNLARQACLA